MFESCVNFVINKVGLAKREQTGNEHVIKIKMAPKKAPSTPPKKVPVAKKTSPSSKAGSPAKKDYSKLFKKCKFSPAKQEPVNSKIQVCIMKGHDHERPHGCPCSEPK